jgi:pimeloyl-ACP methyl ester carboxylesterase
MSCGVLMSAGNVDCCASLPLSEDITDILISETLKCDAHHLGRLMQDHTRLDWRPLLPGIRIPCLCMIGEQSGVFPPAGCEQIAELIPGTTHIDGSHLALTNMLLLVT